ncbi:MAG: hypothetical protein ABR607_14900 [Pyrinomonadaceae bacterium]
MIDTSQTLIKYPNYKSLDDYIDVRKLKSLDSYITARIVKRLSGNTDLKFYTGPFRLKDDAPDRPGSRMIYLAQSTEPDSYFDLDQTDLWRPTPETAEFALLMDFISTLPFKATARMLIMYDEVGRPVPAHRDHSDINICHEFIWFRTNLNKPFYVLNPETNEKRYVESYCAWFDTVNQFHGSDAAAGLSFSIRVDGIFSDDFRKVIPFCATNRAATSALWSSLDSKSKVSLGSLR